MVSACRFRATWKLEKLTQPAFSADPKAEAQAESVAAETSGPAFIKPHWVCSKEGPKPAHRLRATKEGSVSVREGGRARGETEKEDHTRVVQHHTPLLLTLVPENAQNPI